MSIALTCKCGQKFKAKDSLAGRKVKCPICSTVILVPKPQTAAEAPPPRAAKQTQPPPDDPLGLGDDLLGQSFDPLASPTLPSGAVPGSQSAPYLASRTKAPAPSKSGFNPLVLGVCIGGGAVLLLIVGAIGAIWMSSGRDEDQTVADAGQASSTANSVDEGSDSTDQTNGSTKSPRGSVESSQSAPASDQTGDVPLGSGTDETADSLDASDEDADSANEEKTSASPAKPTPQQLARAGKRSKANASPRPKLGTTRHSKPYCLALAEEFLLAVNDGSDVKMSEYIDWTTLLANASFGDHVEGNFRDYFIGENLERSLGPNGFIVRLMEAVKEGGTYTLLRIHDVGDQRRALFRLIGAESGFNYHDLIYEEPFADVIVFIDWYDFSTGELYSDYLRRSYLATVSEADPSLLEGLRGWEGTYAKHIDDFLLLGQSARDQPQVTLDAFNGLADELKREKKILIYRLVAATRLGDREEYEKALQDLGKFYPDDPSVDMMLINYHVARDEYDEAIEAINRLEKAVGGDPYLDVVRYDVYRDSGDQRKARKYGAAAVKKGSSGLSVLW